MHFDIELLLEEKNQGKVGDTYGISLRTQTIVCRFRTMDKVELDHFSMLLDVSMYISDRHP